VSVAAGRPDVKWAGFEAYLLDQVQAAVIATDLTGAVIHWNRHAETLFQWTAEEALGHNIAALLVPPERGALAEGIMDRLRSGESWEGEMGVRRKDGSTVLCYVTDAPILDPDGVVIGTVGVSVDVTERKRGERLIAARTAVTRALSNATSLAEAAPVILRAVCEGLGWGTGVIWRVDRDARVLRCVDGWSTPRPEPHTFVDACHRRTFTPGVGLPGRIWQSAEPAWIADVAFDDNFPRAPEAAAAGLHGAFGFPILVSGEVLGVIELFSDDIREPDGAVLQTLSVISSQVGQFMERKQAEEDLRQSRDQLEAIFQGVAEGITVQDATGRLIYANEAAARAAWYDSLQELLDAAPDDLLARFEILDEAGDPVPTDRLPGRLALEGGEPAEAILCYRYRGTGEVRWSLVRASPVFDGRGDVLFAISIFHDITESRRAADAQLFLSDAIELLGGSLDYRENLRKLAQLSVPRLADWCSVDLLEEDGSATRLALAHTDPEKVKRVTELLDSHPIDPMRGGGLREVLRTGRSRLYPSVTDELLRDTARDETELEILRGLGFRSAMTVPLVAGGTTLGAMALASSESGRRFDHEALAFAEQVASRAALAVQNARLFEEKSRVAEALQKSLLPPRLPEIPGVELARSYLAAGRGNEVGGDFYDVFDLGDGAWALVIGDVCGKGPDAAAVTGLARHTIRAAAMQERKPSRILATLNDAILQQRADNMFCTVALARIRIRDGRCRMTICCGGHPLPFVLRADGSVETAGVPGTLLGIFPDPEMSDIAVDLRPGDAVVLYTDGVIEEHGHGEFFGRDRLLSVLHSCAGNDAHTIAATIERSLLEFRGTPPSDDIATLVARIAPW
jgi:PAS domain S-box-containing protein